MTCWGFGFKSYDLKQGSPNYGPRARCGPRSHFVNDEKIIYSTYEEFVDLVEYNIFHNNHIVYGVRPSTCLVLPYVALGQKSLETPDLK